MITPPRPDNEASRLEALKQYQILDTLAEQEFDDLTYLASQICGTPISAITLIDQDRQWFKSRVGLEIDETPRDVSFCAHTILSDELLVVPDAKTDERFALNPFIAGEPHVRFYAGTPLVTPAGLSVGALCVIDTEPRQMSPQQLDALQRLGRQAVALLETRLNANRLRSSETRYRRLFEASQDGILVISALTGLIEDVNPALCLMLGYAPEEFLGRRLDEIESFREMTAARLGLMASTEQDTVHPADIQIQSKNGNELFVEMVCNISSEDEKRVLQYNIRNITERKRDEIRLRESESSLAKSQQMVGLGSWQLDLTDLDDVNANSLQWSDELFRIFGFEPGEVEVSNELFFGAVHPNDRERVAQAMESALSGAEPYTIVHRILRPDGSERFVESRAELITDEQGRPLRAIGLGLDVTQRQQAEMQLRESEEHLRFVIEASNDGVWEWDLVSGAVTWSERIYTILGVSPAEFQPTYAAQLALVHPDDVEAMQRALEGHLKAGEPYHLRLRYRHRDGHYLHVLSQGKLQRGADGQPLRMIGSFSDLTRLIRVEAEREEKSREIMAIWESMTDAFFSLDAQWCFTHVNHKAGEIWDKSPAELIGRTIWEVFPLAVGTEIQRQYMLAMETRTPVEFEAFYQPKNVWREIHAYPSATGLSVYFRDITKRRKTEEALRRSESLFRTLIDNSWDAFHMVSSTGEILYESPAVTRMLGYLPEEMVGHSTLEFLHPDDFHHLTEDAASLIATPGGLRIIEIRVRHKDGTWRWVESCDVNLLGHPDVGAIAASYRDITERKHAEAERDRFFTTSLDMLGIVGMDGYFKRVNPAFSVTLGYSESELLSRPFMEWIHPDDREASRAVATNLRQGEPLPRFENRYLRQDGSWCWIEWKAVSFPEEGLIYAAARDITERKAAEVSLSLANEELERRVTARTAELAVANESLQVENLEHRTTMASLRQVAEAYRVSQQEAEAASLAKSEFMSRMSHELRTPLNAILGFGQILQSSNLGAEENQQVEQILNGGWHLLDLINEVLDISRVEAGNLALSLEVVPLVEVLAESCALVQPLATQRKVKVDCASARGQEHYVIADRQRLKQVLINLISNGIKYNRENGRVSFSVLPEEDGQIRLGVHDTGHGISAEDRAKLFVAFERLGANKAGIDGTGLGLVLSKYLLTTMGGGIEIESSIGVGSTFWAELPAAAQVSPAVDPIVASPAPVSELKRESDCYQLLSIEDDVSNQRLIQQLLSSRTEITFRGAPSGQAGLRLAFQLQPDLILVNLNLPDISGLEVLQQLRQNDSTRDTPVIVVSADARQPNIETIMTAGATAYLTKPYTVAQMMAAIDRALIPDCHGNLVDGESIQDQTGPIISKVPRFLRILVAEDNAINQKIVAYQLIKMGHQVIVCADGSAAVEAWKSGQYDLILMDCRMPNMDGYEATAEIRRLEAGRNRIPIIALTANALIEDRRNSLAAGMDDHLSKPITQADLTATLQRWNGSISQGQREKSDHS